MFEKEEVESGINKCALYMGTQTVLRERNPDKGKESGSIRERTLRS